MHELFAKFKETVVSLIVWAIVAAGGLLYFHVGRKPSSALPGPTSIASSAPSTALSPPNPAPTAPNTDIDLAGYFATFDQLAGRSSEQGQFVKNMKGKKVRWRGYVSYVRNSDVARSKIALAISPTAGDELRVALVYFGEGMRERLFALRAQDLVEIAGTFDSESWDTPYIQGDTIQPLAAASTTRLTPATADR